MLVNQSAKSEDLLNQSVVEIYTASQRIANLLSIPFTFPTFGSKQAASAFPEIQLIATVVIAVKLYHPFDSVYRCATTLTEPGVMTMDWDAWTKEQKSFEGRLTSGGKLGRGNEIRLKEQEVLDMTADQIDEYLDWYERTWVEEGSKEQKKRGLPTQLLDMFPTGRLDGSSAPAVDPEATASAEQDALDSKLKTVQGSLELRDIVSKEKEGKSKVPVQCIGAFYKRYRKEEDLPPPAKTFYEAAADLIAISLSTLILAVLQTEQKILRYRDRRFKEGIANDASNDEDESPKSPRYTSEDAVEAGESMHHVDGLSVQDLERLGSLDIDASDSETSEMQVDD